MLPLISLTLGLAFLCGLNVYLVAFLASLAMQLGWVTPVLHPALAGLGHPAITVVALVLFIAGFVIDKIPWADSFWDALHTLIRPAGAVLLSLALLQSSDLSGSALNGWIAALAGVIALGTHLTKSGIRLVINASPEPFTNILASLVEDGVVLLLFFLLMSAPVTGFAVCLALLAGTWILLPRLIRLIKASLFLTWKKIFGSGAAVHRPLPYQLRMGQETACRSVLDNAEEALQPIWAVRCVSGKMRHQPGLRANVFGTLTALADQPGFLVYLYRSAFRWRAVRVSLAGCPVRRETTLLSENLVIHGAESGTLATFRFTRGEAALVEHLAQDLRRRLGLEAPAHPGASNSDMGPPLPEKATEIWTAPQSLHH